FSNHFEVGIGIYRLSRASFLSFFDQKFRILSFGRDYVKFRQKKSRLATSYSPRTLRSKYHRRWRA
ncbi:hypothetical protein, partial [Paenibacillus sp. 32O-W]|uniref:hypothetical protein n=1 Tax=Paenibacillus sp. 32O-W TaxID=1695218 RepID=UPI001C93053B